MTVLVNEADRETLLPIRTVVQRGDDEPFIDLRFQGHRVTGRYTGLGLLAIRDGKLQQQILYGDYTTLAEQLAGGSPPAGRQRKESTHDNGWMAARETLRSLTLPVLARFFQPTWQHAKQQLCHGILLHVQVAVDDGPRARRARHKHSQVRSLDGSLHRRCSTRGVQRSIARTSS